MPNDCGRGYSLVVNCGVVGSHCTHAHASFMLLERQKVTPGRSLTQKLHHMGEEVKNRNKRSIFFGIHFFWRRLQVP